MDIPQLMDLSETNCDMLNPGSRRLGTFALITTFLADLPLISTDLIDKNNTYQVHSNDYYQTHEVWNKGRPWPSEIHERIREGCLKSEIGMGPRGSWKNTLVEEEVII